MIYTIEMPTPYPVGNVNAFLVKGDALSIVDVGVKTPEALEALQHGIREAGYEMRDVEQILLTHHHPDHVGWIDAFPKADVLGHSYNDLWLRAEPTFLDYVLQFYMNQLSVQGVPKDVIETSAIERQYFEDVASRPLTHVLKDGEEIPGHPHLKAVYTPGHALSHVIYVNAKESWAIGGDLLLSNMIPNPLIEPPAIQGATRSKSFLQYNESLELLKTFALEKLYPNHGELIIHPNRLIDNQMERSHKQALRFLSFVTDTPQTVFELNKQYYAGLYQAEFALTLSKTQGYIDYLVDKGLLHEELSEEGVFKYTLVKDF